MATSKTIKPTNVSVNIPAMTDAPDQSVNSNCIDKIIDGVNSLYDNDLFSTGTAIPENADLDSYTTPGSFYSSNAARSATISHTPYTAGGFRLLVVPIGTGSRMAFVIPNSSDGYLFLRRYAGTAWDNGWWKLQGISA